jgi:hypothetical protein
VAESLEGLLEIAAKDEAIHTIRVVFSQITRYSEKSTSNGSSPY